MKRLEFRDCEELVEYIDDMMNDLAEKGLADEFDDFSIIAKFEDATEIIKNLCFYYPIADIEISSPMFSGYNDEFIISINGDGIWCKPMKVENKYLYNESTYTFVLDNCSSEVLKYCKSKHIFEVFVKESDEDYEDDDCFDGCHCCGDYDDYECFDDDDDDEDEKYNCSHCDCYDCDDRIVDKKIKCNGSVPDKLSKHVEYDKGKDGDIHGFSVSKNDGNMYSSFSFYSTDKLSVAQIQSMMQEMHI